MRGPTQDVRQVMALYQTLHVVKVAPVVFIGNPAGMLVTLGLLDPAETLWGGIWPFLLVAAMVIPVYLRWRKLRRAPPPARVSERSLRRTAFFSAMLGFTWMAIYIAVQGRMPEEVVGPCLAAIYVVAIGGAASFAPVPSVGLAFAGPLMTTALLVLALRGHDLASPEYLLFGGFAVAFWIVMASGYAAFRNHVRILAEHSSLLAEKTSEAERRRITEEALSKSISRLRDTQEQLVEQEKLASLGQLVAGVAHEINTPVGIALTGATVLRNETKKLKQLADEGQARKSDVQKYFSLCEETADLIAANCSRAADLVQGFKQVAVDQASEARREVALAAYLREVMFSLRPKLKTTTHDVVIDCPHDVIMDTYPGCLSQIVTNFITNSLLHAFDPGQAGRMTIIVRAPDRESVELTYRDDGRGIPLDVQGKIFEPFYTTKRGQGGSGLGLHIVYNLVTRKLKGSLQLESAPGQGTAFILRLPRVTPRNEPAPSRPGVETIAVP